MVSLCICSKLIMVKVLGFAHFESWFSSYCKELVLEAVYSPTTHAQVFCVEASRFYLSIYLYFM